LAHHFHQIHQIHHLRHHLVLNLATGLDCYHHYYLEWVLQDLKWVGYYLDLNYRRVRIHRHLIHQPLLG
jgi:hypothetical protein